MPGIRKCSRSSSTSGVISPEVFGDERQIAEDLFQALKELMPGGLDPLAVDCGFLLGGDRPVGLEAAKVVEPDHVIERNGRRIRLPTSRSRVLAAPPTYTRVTPALAGAEK